MRGLAFLFLILFTASLFFEYIAVRRGWLKMPVAVIAGSVVNSLCFIAYSAASETQPLHAVIVGAFIGCLFTIMAMIAASYFNSQQGKVTPVTADIVAVESE